MLGNSLETFDENVFKVFLENGGALDFFNSKSCFVRYLVLEPLWCLLCNSVLNQCLFLYITANLNCDCDIAWLIVKRRELLKNANVWCRSNTLISELHAEKFEHCFILEVNCFNIFQ